MSRATSALSLRDKISNRRSTVNVEAITDTAKNIMNRFLTRKRAKKPRAEVKPEIDIQNALPQVDTFRQSLLMNGLSTRFSMLKEQDDPTSLIGKASDDSVLQPRRQSRLMEFGFSRGLTDIAEVGSLHDVRPPFADKPRAGSFASEGGYATDGEETSMMDRARPLGEGNIVFGGRQKVYMVPNSAQSATSLGGGLKGRALYDDDVGLSTFQRMRKQQREERALQEKDRSSKSSSEINSPAKTSLDSVVEQNLLRRQASDSTTVSSPSTNARSSTAATSVVSRSTSFGNQSTPPSQAASPSFAPLADRSTFKSKRLYEQGLDREIKEQQTSSMTRLNSIHRGRGGNGRQTPDMMRSQSSVRRQGMRVPRPTSPVIDTTASPSLETPSKQWPLATSPLEQRQPALPNVSMTPFDEDEEKRGIFQSTIDPDDRGKATAMGVFNKPQKFSETKFLERTMTLNQGRSPPSQSPTDERPADSQLYLRKNSAVAGASRSVPPPKESVASNAFNVFQKAASQLKTPMADTSRKDSAQQPSPLLTPPAREFDEEDDELTPQADRSSERMKALEASISPTMIAPPSMQDHPAFRKQSSAMSTEDPYTTLRKQPNFGLADAKALRTHLRDRVEPPAALGASNPGLSGLIRQHLRNESDASQHSFASSHYPEMPLSPVMTSDVPLPLDWRLQKDSLAVQQPTDVDSPALSDSVSNPWELENEYDGPYGNEADSLSSDEPRSKPVSAVDSSNVSIVSQNDNSNRASEVSEEPHWQQELMKRTHQRGGSNETAQERLAFERELAHRREAVTQKLRAHNENARHTVSPLPTPPARAGPFRGLEMLRSKSSRESFKLKAERPIRAMGLGSSTNLSAMSERPFTTCSNDSSEQLNTRSASRPAASRDAQDDDRRPSWARSSEENSRSRKNSTANKNSIAMESMVADKRARSGSVSNGRSRSRAGRQHDFDMPINGDAHPEPSPAIPNYYQTNSSSESSFAMPHPAVRPQAERADSSRSNGLGISNKPESYFDMKGTTSTSSFSSNPSPLVVPNRAGQSPYGLPISPRPSPGLVSHYPLSPDSMGPPSNSSNTLWPSSHATPPLSAATSPNVPAFPAPHVIQSQMAHATSYSRDRAPKRVVQKSQISEPTFKHTTSSIDTVELPAEASLQNGMDEIEDHKEIVVPSRRRYGIAGLGKIKQTELASTQYVNNKSSFDDSTEWQPQMKKEPSPTFNKGPSPTFNERGMF